MEDIKEDAKPKKADRPAQKRPISEIMDDLAKPIPPRLLEQKPATGSRNSEMLTYCPWHRVQRILNHYTGGFCSYETRTETVISEHYVISVRITIHAEEGDFVRDGKGLEPLDTSAYGNFVHNAESQAFRRAAARFGLGLGLYDG